MKPLPTPLSEMAPVTRDLHLAIDARMRATGVPDLHPDGPTILPDLIGAESMIDWQDVKADASLLAQTCWSEQPTVYGRYATDPGQHLLEKVRRLYDAKAVVLTDCGAQAICLAIDVLLKPGGHAILARQIYGKTRIYLEWYADRIGAEITIVDHIDGASLLEAARPNTQLVLAETFSNPLTRAMDPDEVSDAMLALRAGPAPSARIVIDDTICTAWGPKVPFLSRPGLDVIAAAGTKAIAGQDQDLLGYVCTQDLGIGNAVMDHLATRGGALSWRVAEVVAARLNEADALHARRCHNATAVAAFLAGHPGVSAVFHPSLPDHPDADVVARAYARPGSLLSFRVGDCDEAGVKHFCNVLAMTLVWRYALSFDGLVSKINHHTSVSEHFTPAPRLRRQGIDRLIRLAAGVEDAADLVGAMAWALEHHTSFTLEEVAAWQKARAADLGVPWPHARPSHRP